MKGGRLPRGYTIIEVMIVLAVSGVLFLIAANFISGKQERTSFQQGSNEFASRVQSVITEVTDGHYTDVHINCSADPAAAASFVATFPFLAPSPANQDNCVFLGKLMHFSVSGNYNQYNVFSIAGARLVSNTPVTVQSSSTPFQNTRLAAIVPLNPAIVITKHLTLPQNLDVGSGATSMVVTDSAGITHTTSYNIGFIQGLGSNGTHPGWYQSGSQTIQMVYVNFPLKGQTESIAQASITPTTVVPAISATICITDHTRSANIIIGGGSNNQLQVSVKQLGAVACP